MKVCNGRFTQWKCYMHSITWVNRSMIWEFINMSPYQFLHGENSVLSIELSIPTWFTLPWNSVRSRVNLLALWVRQLKQRKEDVKKATLYLRCEKKENKKLFDEKHWINDSFDADDLILLHNTKLNNCYDIKFALQWFELYWIREVIVIKGTYLFKKLDGILLNDTVSDNWIKCFYHQNLNLDPALYTEEAAFSSLVLLIEGELTVPLNWPPLDLAILPAQGFVTYELCIQSSHHRTEVMSLLLHNAVVSESSHHGVEVVMPSSDLEALINIIHNE